MTKNSRMGPTPSKWELAEAIFKALNESWSLKVEKQNVGFCYILKNIRVFASTNKAQAPSLQRVKPADARSILLYLEILHTQSVSISSSFSGNFPPLVNECCNPYCWAAIIQISVFQLYSHNLSLELSTLGHPRGFVIKQVPWSEGASLDHMPHTPPTWTFL